MFVWGRGEGVVSKKGREGLDEERERGPVLSLSPPGRRGFAMK